MGLSLPFGDGGIGILRWLWLKSKGCVALHHPASLKLGSDSWRCRCDTQLAALNQAQKSILS